MFAEMLQRRWYASTVCFLLLLPVLVLTYEHYFQCSQYSECGNLGGISYPFRLLQSPSYCGYPGYELNCVSDNEHSNVTINLKGNSYIVKRINYETAHLLLVDPEFVDNPCPRRFDVPRINSTLFRFTDLNDYLTVYLNCSFAEQPSDLLHIDCPGNSYYKMENGSSPFPENFTDEPECMITVKMAVYEGLQESGGAEGFDQELARGFQLKWLYSADWCDRCLASGGLCGYNESSPQDQTCFCPNRTASGSCSIGKMKSSKRKEHLIIAVCIVASLSLVSIFCTVWFFTYLRGKRNKRFGSTLLGRVSSLQPSSKSDTELNSLHAPIFSYDELHEATNGFDPSRELGDGGFGIVYKGTLKDGLFVAVKRLYENNHRLVEQFINEIKILSLLRHPNLVTLYGCTSRHSRELLLVYEFVPNGTVADHLYGSRATESFLPWHTRMSIAIETADALSYLHSIEPHIIHRDIKTNNLLLDDEFHVKVADFGLSRLFPMDATHVSTAPQGTPGYVDPEYHHCYQLTDKSDVYSFGVVLAELLSSKPAVDMTRNRNDINLANMAVNMIQRQELHELVDPRLGYHSDCEVNRMITQVAELAFQCLQSDGEMRPCIKDVLLILEGIKSSGQKKEIHEEMNATWKEEALPLKSSKLYSPNSVTQEWGSSETTPNASG